MDNLRRAFVISACSVLASGTVDAQQKPPAWPTRPVRLLVGFPGGSSPDIAARSIAEPLSRLLGQAVVVDNKPGASGNIAVDMVAKATDEHTLGVVINGNLTSSKMLNPTLSFDPAKDFAHLSLLATAPLILVAIPEVPSGSEFFDAARSSGDRWSYGSVGMGSLGQLGMELLKSQLPGFRAEHIPYQGNPQIIAALLGNQVQLALIPPGVALPHVRSGKLKAIGLTGDRSPLAPEVASFSDMGLQGFHLEVWVGLVGPASLSPALRARIGTEIGRVMKSPEVRQLLLERGWSPVGSSAEGMRMRVEKETALMTRIIQTKGIQLQ
ncbi:Bug family tripartite tricarboxylate transporter substrate binding protein [Variovorax paradoxus]|uniref:Bug family tripartite tricarboxylate transporter substrate binding protein n=1 Tax=Variovorax paradoxus TaxID=34073 RepID=UPI00278973F9|nr:tripartite tricarboxylate transporter substrate binding protein [Variovorax paradoxus]MDQ0587882.1 tripartite-type tricarboxylate transporter receptor subunit TctC [Variovorax paradoxus]